MKAICLFLLFSLAACVTAAHDVGEEKIDRYQARFGRERPIVAVLADNRGTEVTDFVIPYGVLTRSAVADVIAVSARPGVINLGSMQVQSQMSIAEFDTRFPQGADYVIVPAFFSDYEPPEVDIPDPALTSWISAQSTKGGTTMSICVGAIAVARAGLLDGRRATSYYANERQRAENFPKVLWEKNIRYVSDGKFVSTAGVSASIPASLALVEAIAGRDKSESVARDIGVTDWTSRHNSDVFQPRPGEPPMTAANNALTKTVGIHLRPGADEIGLALTADAYTHTGVTRSLLVADSTAPITTRGGLRVIPGGVLGVPQLTDRVLPRRDDAPPAQALDDALADIEQNYGRPAAAGVARVLEYPRYQR